MTHMNENTVIVLRIYVQKYKFLNGLRGHISGVMLRESSDLNTKVRDSCGISEPGETPQVSRRTEEAPGSPAESEQLKCH
jgi:hypothetical protein